MITFFSITILCFFFLSAGCSIAQTTEDIETFEVKVFFHCINGKKYIETKLSAVDGVQSAVVSLDTRVTTIVYDKKVLNNEKLVEIIEQMGYFTEYSDMGKKIKKSCKREELPKPDKNKEK